MIHNLFPNDVYLEPKEHKYYDSEGNQYISFSALYGKLVKKFDADAIAGHIARNSDKSKEEIISEWNNKTNSGTRIDKALELYAQTATILDSDDDLKELVPYVLEKYKIYNKTFEQGVPYSKKYRVAGSWDKLSIVTNRKDSRFHLSDFKSFEDRKNDDGSVKLTGYDSLFSLDGSDKWLNEPFSHLPNNKYTKISFQLSFYASLIEGLTGRKCEKLFIDLIVPTCDNNGKVISYKNHIVPVNYLKNDIKIFLETFQDEIRDMLDNTINISVSEDEIF